jgi:hypothetical protein
VGRIAFARGAVALRLIIAAALVLVAVGVAWRLRAKAEPDPVRAPGEVPRQLHRADFPRAAAPWLVVLFSSASCHGCAVMAGKVGVLESADVAVCEMEYTANRAVHERYAIDSVPLVVVADDEGVTRAAFLGPTSATDLWAALAELRQPGSTPEPDLGQLSQ